MSEELKQHWRDELELFYVPPGITIEWAELQFRESYFKYNRDGIIFTGPNGASEASPLPGYFNSSYQCIRGALDSISFEWPEAVRSLEDVKLNILVSDDVDLPLVDSSENIKVKVLSFEDIDRVKHVRDIAGITANIRIDCNGSFDVDDALKVIKELHSINLEFVEQPCKSNEENAELRKKTDVLIALDETANTREEIDEIQILDAADLIVVKVQSAGGIFSALDIIDQWGKDFVISSMMETSVGTELGFVLARSVPELKYASGLCYSPLNNVIREPLYG